MGGNFRTHDEEGALDGMTLDEYLIENEQATFIVRMRGDAMRDAGIHDGDLLVVDRSREPRRGDAVLAVEDGEFVVRRFSSLRSSDAKVEAVVTAVVRKYT